MAQIQTRKLKTCTTYRVEFMKNGKRLSKSFKKKKEAEKFAATLVVDEQFADSLTNHHLNHLTLSNAIDEYLEQYTGKDNCVNYRLNWWHEMLGSKVIGNINRSSIKAALKQLKDNGLAAGTLNRYKANLSSVFQFVIDEYDLIISNPCRQVKQSKEPKPPEENLSENELKKLLNAARESRWERLYLLILMAVSTGARRSELLNLTWTDLDFKQKTAYLGNTKNDDRRVLPLTDEVLTELKPLRQVGGFLFPHPHSNRKPFRNFDPYWYAILKDAGVKIRFHGLRHTTGSWLAAKGVHLKAIGEILGHKTIQTTQRYVHHSTEHKAIEINRVFGGIANA